MAFQALHKLVDALGNLPPLLQLRRREFERRFCRGVGHPFHGVYESFAAAEAAIPSFVPASYDNPAAASMYVGHLGIDDYDYPVLFWLQEALRLGMRSVVDVGGSTGIKFYAFREVLPMPAELSWRVVEVPAAVALGRELASKAGVASQLAFTSELADADGTDVLLASGSLQYLPRSLGEILASLPRKPRRVLVNTTPIHASRSFFTRNHIGTACCPYRVTARDAFLAEVAAQGYVLRTAWSNRGKSLRLPFEKGLDVEHYSGFCFDRTGA